MGEDLIAFHWCRSATQKTKHRIVSRSGHLPISRSEFNLGSLYASSPTHPALFAGRLTIGKRPTTPKWQKQPSVFIMRICLMRSSSPVRKFSSLSIGRMGGKEKISRSKLRDYRPFEVFGDLSAAMRH